MHDARRKVFYKWLDMSCASDIADDQATEAAAHVSDMNDRLDRIKNGADSAISMERQQHHLRVAINEAAELRRSADALKDAADRFEKEWGPFGDELAESKAETNSNTTPHHTTQETTP